MKGGEAPGLQIVGDQCPDWQAEGHLPDLLPGTAWEVEHSMAGAYVEHHRQQRRFFLHRVQP